jgi:hypothetical protein
MYVRTIALLAFAVISVDVDLVTSRADASTRHHHHRHYSNHHLSLSSKYSWWWFDPYLGTRTAHFHRWHRELSSDRGMASLHGDLVLLSQKVAGGGI